MSSSQDTVLSYCGFVLYLFQVHKVSCFVIVAFLWSFIFVQFTRCRALLLWPFFGLLSMSSSQGVMLCYCGFSLVFYLCQVHKMTCFVITVFLWSFFNANISIGCALFLWRLVFLYAKFTRCHALLLRPFLCSYIFNLCLVHKITCFVIAAFLMLLYL